MRDSVLDIGCGIRPQQLIDGDITALEPHDEYREWLALHRPDIKVVAGQWSDAPQLFEPLSFDHVTILDVIEHLDKDEALRLLAYTLMLARKSVTVYTPLGFFEQAPGEGGCDKWGMSGGEWQRHRSGWTPDDFRGWEISTHERQDKPTMMMATWRR